MVFASPILVQSQMVEWRYRGWGRGRCLRATSNPVFSCQLRNQQPMGICWVLKEMWTKGKNLDLESWGPAFSTWLCCLMEKELFSLESVISWLWFFKHSHQDDILVSLGGGSIARDFSTFLPLKNYGTLDWFLRPLQSLSFLPCKRWMGTRWWSESVK